MDESRFVEACRVLVPLGPWLELCEAAEVEYVPADFSEPFPVRQIGEAVDGREVPELNAAFEWLDARVAERCGAGESVSARWECCSSERAKMVAAAGNPWGESYYRLTPDDLRVEECTVGLQTRLCLRPWITAMRYDGYPVEFRYFRNGDGSNGVSNYYPQRALSDYLHLGYANTVLILGKQLADTMMTVPRSPLSQAGYKVGFSADFIVREDGQVIFLEGGPPYVAVPPHPWCPSAHPCCFPPGETVGLATAPMEVAP
jgi:hypothetical protein